MCAFVSLYSNKRTGIHKKHERCVHSVEYGSTFCETLVPIDQTARSHITVIFTVTPLPWEFIISQQTPVLPSKLYTHLIITMVSATSPPNLELNKTCGAAGRTLWCRAGPGPVTSRRCDYSSATRGESQHRDNWFNSLTSVRDCYREETWTCPYWFLQLSFNFPSSFSLFLLSVVISIPPFRFSLPYFLILLQDRVLLSIFFHRLLSFAETTSILLLTPSILLFSRGRRVTG